jgi:hydrogenase nickel incorporation protein HypB
MCGTCGCADPANEVSMTDMTNGARRVLREGAPGEIRAHAGGERHHAGHRHYHGHDHHHEHEHAHDHDHGTPHAHGPRGEVIPLEAAILAANDRRAARNRGWFEGRRVVALNLMSAPGSGKTSLIERTIRELAGRPPVTVIEGDQMTTADAERVRAAGARAVQINTGAGCHLEADMVGEAAAALDPEPGSILMIENVGNLVCPAMFDLGERARVVVFSTPEGPDKPAKYPHMFRAADMVLVNKIDLAPHLDFDPDACRAALAAVNPKARILFVSARTGAGFGDWLTWLRELETA